MHREPAVLSPGLVAGASLRLLRAGFLKCSSRGGIDDLTPRVEREVLDRQMRVLLVLVQRVERLPQVPYKPEPVHQLLGPRRNAFLLNENLRVMECRTSRACH